MNWQKDFQVTKKDILKINCYDCKDNFNHSMSQMYGAVLKNTADVKVIYMGNNKETMIKRIKEQIKDNTLTSEIEKEMLI
jgi:hypothetical protein